MMTVVRSNQLEGVPRKVPKRKKKRFLNERYYVCVYNIRTFE